MSLMNFRLRIWSHDSFDKCRFLQGFGKEIIGVLGEG